MPKQPALTPQIKTTAADVPLLNDRARNVLSDVVHAFQDSGQAVASAAVVEWGKYDVSSASIRNTMIDLEKQGLLYTPHTSAGKKPTEDGFRFYATHLVQAEKPSLRIRQKLDIAIAEFGKKDTTTVLRGVSDTLSDITGCAGLITAPKRVHDPLNTVEFVRLSGDKVLAVLVSESGHIENRMLEVPAFISVDDLNHASRQLRDVVGGKTLLEAKTELLVNLAEQRGRVNTMIDNMMQAASDWGEPTVDDGAMVVAGSNQLFQYPELVREKLQSLVKLFEEKRLLMALMDEVQIGDGVQIFVGKDCPLEGMRDTMAGDMSLITGTYGTSRTEAKSNAKSQPLGTLGVIGPMRLNYAKTMGVVDYTREKLSEMVLLEHS